MQKSNKKRLPESFFNRNTLRVAQEMLGKVLCIKNGGKILIFLIPELLLKSTAFFITFESADGKAIIIWLT